jgi:hypothetical protein
MPRKVLLNLSRLDSVVGLVALAAFLASGLYIHLRYDHLRGLDDPTRLLFRSSHIYLFLSRRAASRRY